MLRIVADTNVVVSGLLWHGPSRAVLDAARAGDIWLFTSPALVEELGDVLVRPKFAPRLAQAHANVDDLLTGFSLLAVVVEPQAVEAVVSEDPDDDAVLACAVAARADAIVSGDQDLHRVGIYRGIPVLSAAELVTRLQT